MKRRVPDKPNFIINRRKVTQLVETPSWIERDASDKVCGKPECKAWEREEDKERFGISVVPIDNKEREKYKRTKNGSERQKIGQILYTYK